jgi:endoglucanase Acf2
MLPYLTARALLQLIRRGRPMNQNFNRPSDFSLRGSAATLGLLLLLAGSAIAQPVPVGSGSYSTSLPTGETGPMDFFGASAVPKVSADFNQPIQTNDFWSSLIYPFFGSPWSNILYAHPINAKAVSSGLEIGHTADPVFVANDFLYPYAAQLTVGVSGMSAQAALTHHYGDWTVTARWEDGPRSMEATLGHGLPFVYFKLTGGGAELAANGNLTIWHQQDEVLGLSVDGRHFGVFAPAGSVWTVSSPFQSALNGGDYFAVALLPDNSPEILELFRSHAYARVTDSRVLWSYNEATAQLSTSYSYDTVLEDDSPGNLNEVLGCLYRHQWLHTNQPLLGFSYASPRGEMKLYQGNTFSTELAFAGILPALPDEGNYNREVLASLVQDVASESLPVGPTYENGKLIARFSNLVHIADQLDAIPERDHFLSEIKSRLEEWFQAGGEQEYSYNGSWNVLTGYPSGYGADDQINDHHFHASYAVMAAATVALFDSAWASQEEWGGMVNLLIRDANSWNREDELFPFLRSFDAYAGHSWAAGHGDFAEGNNQESSSESMNFAAAAFLWGEATNQPEIRDLGIFLHTTEASAVEHYWFDVDDQVFPPSYPHVAIGMVWGGKGVHSTWFGAEPEFIHGINLLPITSASLYLGRQPDYVLANYAEIVAERGGQPVIWQDILWQYLALADPDQALAYYYADPDYEVFDGESRAHTCHWLYNLKKLGHVETAITADIPTYSVFRDDAGDLSYVAFNASSAPRTVSFSDGFSMLVGPKETATHSTSPVDPDAPIVLLFADRTSGKLPLTVNFTGSGSFDPNGLELDFHWDLGDGTSMEGPEIEHVFTELDSFMVSLTVSNSEGLSSADSLLIRVLPNGTPYLGQPFALPGLVQAEYYDLGGEAIAYHDVDAINHGVPFRSDEGVDLEASSDAGYDIHWIEDGEWVEYTVDVAQAGYYRLVPSVASVPGGGSLHIEFNGIDMTGPVSVPVTGGWQFWQEMSIPDVYLEAGEQIMHVGFHVGQFSLNWIDVRPSSNALEDESTLPARARLEQNYPNPFNPVTQIDYQLPTAGLVQLRVYNMLGQEVASIVDQLMPAGHYSCSWDASGQSSGIYMVHMSFSPHRANGGSQNLIRKMVLLK